MRGRKKRAGLAAARRQPAAAPVRDLSPGPPPGGAPDPGARRSRTPPAPPANAGRPHGDDGRRRCRLSSRRRRVEEFPAVGGTGNLPGAGPVCRPRPGRAPEGSSSQDESRLGRTTAFPGVTSPNYSFAIDCAISRRRGCLVFTWWEGHAGRRPRRRGFRRVGMRPVPSSARRRAYRDVRGGFGGGFRGGFRGGLASGSAHFGAWRDVAAACAFPPAGRSRPWERDDSIHRLARGPEPHRRCP